MSQSLIVVKPAAAGEHDGPPRERVSRIQLSSAYARRRASVKMALVIMYLSAAAFAQSVTHAGSVKHQGTVQVENQSSQNTLIFALFPPEGNTDQTSHFGPTVMMQNAIDGITQKVVWSSVETGTPGPNTCSPVGTDTCQLDAFGWTHIFSWSSVDSALAYWFNAGNVNLFGTKKVNILGFGEGGPAAPINANTATPYYVTTPSWISHTGGVQDVINFQQNGCTSFKGPSTTSITSDGSGVATATVTALSLNQQNGFVVGDTIWVSGASPSTLNTLGTAGTQISNVSGSTFQYQSSCNGCTASTQGNVITNVLSWLVPYETPMKTARKTFMTAAIQHFGPNHSGITVNPSQVYYMRFGKSVGGESFVYCSTGLGGTTPPYSISVWQNYITEMTSFEQAQSPTMLIFQPINRVASDDTDYSNYEAKDAIAHSNAYGLTFGFGSQGLSLYDESQYPAACASNWCGLFNSYYAQGSPLELQQIANSDPTDNSCGAGGMNCVPGGDAGDLRVWLPFAVGQRHLNVLELYSVDADLAFDPNFCVLNAGGTACVSGSYASLNGLTAAQQLKFFQPDGSNDGSGVGLGHSCASGTQSGANGDCSYSSTINAQHGYH